MVVVASPVQTPSSNPNSGSYPTPPSGQDAYGTTWRTLRIGAGGFLRGIDIAPDGTKVVRTDTYGAYVWNPNIRQWVQLVTAQSMPAYDVDMDISNGVYEIRIAPSNSNRFYMMYNGYVYRTDNRGSAWTKTNFNPTTRDPGYKANDGFAQDGEKMAVDPANPDVVYAGTEGSGLWVTTNAGTSWAQVTGVAVGASSGAGITGIAFDPNSGTTAGKTNDIYADSWGNGVYVSTDAGATWTKTTGGPTNVENAVVSSDGIYYAAAGTALWRYANNTWTKLYTDTNGQQVHSIAVDPANSSRLIIGGAGGTFNVSVDKGATWTDWIWGGKPAYSRISTDIPWLAWTNEGFMTNGNMVFDPTATNTLYFAEGIGVWYTNYPTSNITWQTGVTWNDMSAGIEQLVSNEVISPPGGKPVLAAWDRPLFYVNNPDVYPSSHGPNNLKAIVQSGSVDWASSNPSFIAADVSGPIYSSDGGQTWNNFPTNPSVSGAMPGAIAAASPTNILWANPLGGLYYTKDGGNTWSAVSGPTNSGWPYYLDRQILAADRVNIGTFYAYVNNALWRTTDGGTTWTNIHNSEITPFSWYNAKLRAVPGQAGNLFFTGGQCSPDSIHAPCMEAFMRSIDGGVTWTTIPNINEVFDIGFGKAKMGSNYPSIFIAGFVNSKYGIWESDDNAATWFQIGMWPLNSMDGIKSISGDMNQYGRVYVAFGGSGWAYGDTSNSTPPTADTTAPSIPTNLSATAISSSQVNLTWTASTDNVGVTGYKLYRGGTQVGTSATNSYSDSALTASTTYSYTVSAYDAAGNASAQSSSANATTLVDTTPPVITIAAPSGRLAAGTTQTTLSVTTNENATCAWSNTAGSAFVSMTQFTTTGGTSHATTLSGLTNGSSYTTYVKCKDTVGNISTDSSVSYSVGTVTFTQTANPPTQTFGWATTPVTFSNVNIGTPSADRIVVVGYYGQVPPSLTINGTVATKAVETSVQSGGFNSLSIWYANIPTGTSANIVIGSAAYSTVGIQVGILTGANPTPTATSSAAFTYSPQPHTLTGTVPTNGIGIIFAFEGNTGGVPSWTNATEDNYTNDVADNTQLILAHSYTPGALTWSLVSGNSTSYDWGLNSRVMASWSP